MARSITCPGCETRYTLSDSFSAANVTCKKCRASIPCPTAEDETGESTAVAADQPRRRVISSADFEPPRNLRERRERMQQPAKPFYTAPMFYVGIVATVVCVYFSIKFA
jgi:hypothetical protein